MKALPLENEKFGAATSYRERLDSLPTRGLIAPVLAVTIGAVEMKLEQDDWACSLDGILGRIDEYVLRRRLVHHFYFRITI